MTNHKIPFNKPHLCGNELKYIAEAHATGQLAGDGRFTQRCHTLLEEMTHCSKALLTHSCTAALEIAALLADMDSEISNLESKVSKIRHVKNGMMRVLLTGMTRLV